MRTIVALMILLATVGCATTEQWHYQGDELVTAVTQACDEGEYNFVSVEVVGEKEYIITCRGK